MAILRRTLLVVPALILFLSLLQGSALAQDSGERFIPEEARIRFDCCVSRHDPVASFTELQAWLAGLAILVILGIEAARGNALAARIGAMGTLLGSSALLAGLVIEAIEEGLAPTEVVAREWPLAFVAAAVFLLGWCLLRWAASLPPVDGRPRRLGHRGPYGPIRRCRIGCSRMRTPSAVERIRPPTSRS